MSLPAATRDERLNNLVLSFVVFDVLSFVIIIWNFKRSIQTINLLKVDVRELLTTDRLFSIKKIALETQQDS